MTSTPEVPEAPAAPDQTLIDSRDQARAALEEITPAKSIGAAAGYEVHDERVVTLLFECRLDGYLGWHWAASVTRVDDESPVNVLEVGLLPGEGSVLAPEWVPWSARLAQYRETQAMQAAEEAAAAQAAADELAEEDDDNDDDILDNDFSDFDDEIDGVDIDELDEDAAGDDDDDDDNDDDEDPDDDDPEGSENSAPVEDAEAPQEQQDPAVAEADEQRDPEED